MATNCILWGESIPGLLACLLNTEWIAPALRGDVLEICMGAQVNNWDIDADTGQMSTSVEIWLPMSHKTLTSSEEDIK